MNQIEGIPNAPLYGGFHKIISPWTIKTEPGISVMIMDASGKTNLILHLFRV